MNRILSKILNSLFNRGHKHFYLERAGIHCYPDNNWGNIHSFRSLLNVLKQRRREKKLSINPRDCWSLDDTFYLWLYEHLCLLLDDTNADLTWHKFKHNDKEYTEEEYIEYLKSLCLDMINFDEFKDCPDINWDIVNSEGEKEYRTLEFLDEEKKLGEFREQSKKNYENQEALRKELCSVFCELLPHLWW